LSPLQKTFNLDEEPEKLRDAYGRNLAQSGPTDNAYLYAGEQRDRNLGLDYLRARYLNVNAGRFYGRDPKPMGGRAGISQTFGYASLNPVGATAYVVPT
jgi:RHS repeat-associated protein